MQMAIPQSYVIWYDSVTNNGELEWQNELNSSNRFVLCLLHDHFIIVVFSWIDYAQVRPFQDPVKDAFVFG